MLIYMCGKLSHARKGISWRFFIMVGSAIIQVCVITLLWSGYKAKADGDLYYWVIALFCVLGIISQLC